MNIKAFCHSAATECFEGLVFTLLYERLIPIVDCLF